MKKRIVAVALAALVVFALPVAAFAVDVPSAQGNSGSTTVNGVTVNWDATGLRVPYARISIEPASSDFSRVTVGANDKAFEALEIKLFDADGNEIHGDFGTLTISISVGTENNGKAFNYYINHSDGSFEDGSGTVQGGFAVVNFMRLSSTKVVVTDAAAGSGGAVSPKTGAADLTAVYAMVFGALFVAAGVAFALRKRNEQ